MHRYLTIAAVALPIALAAEASAADPHLSGAYLFQLTGLCQATFTYNATGHLNALRGGGMTQTVGTLTFTPSVPYGASGRVVAKYTIVDGAAVRVVQDSDFISPPGVRMTQQIITLSGGYSVTAAGLTLRLAGLPKQVFRAYYGAADANGRRAQANFVRLIQGTPDGQVTVEEDCSEGGTLDAL
ncbi:MAG: hypothetical protein KDK89_01560 [Alphaproteobacteria bacterium]|nr:hypothetical protein [Alphaproteobacteria bacterium]